MADDDGADRETPRRQALATGIVHDFNNMLLALTACMELVRTRSTETRIRDIAGRGLDSIERCKDLVDRILVLGGVEPPGKTGEAGGAPAAAPEREPLILVVDDDNDVRLVLGELLHSLGYRLVEAADGAAALAALDRQPDLAIVDCELRGQRGTELAGQLLDRRPGLPVVFATGYSEAAPADPRLSAAPFLHKPFRISDLANTVAAALRP